MRNIFFVALFLLFLSGCGEKLDSVCGNTGGQCCAVRYGDSGNGKYSSSVFMCLKNAQSCLELANKYGGVADYPHSIDIGSERDKCEAKVKVVPIWQTLQSFAILASAYVKSDNLVRVDGSTAASGDADYCEIACETGHAGVCQIVSVPNDTSLGMLTSFVDLAEKATDQPQVTTMRQVLKNFALTEDANGCRRGDIVSSTKAIVNSASEQCVVGSIPTTGAKKQDATLSLPLIISGRPLPQNKTVLWEDNATAIGLQINDSALAQRFSGPIKAASRIQYDGLAAKIQGQNDVGCAEIVGQVSKELDVGAAAKLIQSNPNVIRSAMRSFSSYRESTIKLLSEHEANNLNSLAFVAKLFPNTEYIDKVNEIAKSNSLQQYAGDEQLGDSGTKISASNVIRMIDIQLCSDANATTSTSDLISLVPVANSNDDLSRLSAERSEIAGRIIQCKFSALKIPPEVKDLLRAYLKN
ncbi:hypothetical protein MOV66_02560 [Agrobacterium sp. SHOUNA12C]|nr:hypothetical protein [Agrobacterium sp. BETTINA12B]MCJ9755515.1 hypothetical protein [Agrobacterium sp. SHOUNA12C]NTG34777.1 hypothetical protein [Rhizobium rhizogenes]NTG54026.1 hypothetical protein [Rhizobium rhizogenes]